MAGSILVGAIGCRTTSRFKLAFNLRVVGSTWLTSVSAAVSTSLLKYVSMENAEELPGTSVGNLA